MSWRSAHRGGLELSTGTGLYGACRSTQCCLAVWSRRVESSTRLGGFRALKKTTEAPYTTKVNNRERTPRGPTLGWPVAPPPGSKGPMTLHIPACAPCR